MAALQAEDRAIELFQPTQEILIYADMMLSKTTQTGDYMSDTIELLEAIGRDASLRHASSEELANVLQQSQASSALAAAVASGDSSLLSVELGHKPMYLPQVVQTPGHEEDETDQDEDDQSDTPSTPDTGKSSTDESNT